MLRKAISGLVSALRLDIIDRRVASLEAGGEIGTVRADTMLRSLKPMGAHRDKYATFGATVSSQRVILTLHLKGVIRHARPKSSSSRTMSSSPR